MDADQELFDHAVDQMRRRWPDAQEAVAAAVRLDDGSILTGIALDNFNAAMSLCAETGPICEAYTAGRRIIASICVSREDGREGVTVLAPCGACQERLALWGPDVRVGVSDPDQPEGWSSRSLVELNPFYWATVFAEGGIWPSIQQHAG
ncbi:cytidine deaminase [Glaciihabitans sp. dw_435]|uniref:cytidine deaminase n=1 Tax=Glaciihabitans sp. dw_435 TaxID=2720081 RepID=UPI001BD63425|nr:cytidine deaminase [Glaciihabitans sp. dw_435]